MRRDDECRPCRPLPDSPTYCGGAGPRRPRHPTGRRPTRAAPRAAAGSRARGLAPRTPPPGGGRGCPARSRAARRSPVARRANTCARSAAFGNWTTSPSRRIRSTAASANHASASSMRRSRCSGSEDVDPARARWLELAVEIAEDADAHRLAWDEDHRDRDATRERRRGLRVRGDRRARPHRRGPDGHRRGEPRRAGARRARDPRPLRRAARRAGSREDRALVERAGARHVLVDRAGAHERGRRDRHRALGSQGQAARRPRVRPPRRADARAGACLPPSRGQQRGGAGGGRAPLARAGLHRAPLRPARRVRRPLARALGSAGARSSARSPPRRHCAARSATTST